MDAPVRVRSAVSPSVRVANAVTGSCRVVMPSMSRCCFARCATSCGAPSRPASVPASSGLERDRGRGGVRVVLFGQDELEPAVTVGDDADPAARAEGEVLPDPYSGQWRHFDVHWAS